MVPAGGYPGSNIDWNAVASSSSGQFVVAGFASRYSPNSGTGTT
jgi:hypothetical protein